MLTLLVKICTLVLMESTFYTFGGRIWKQAAGAGIGLRASACLAKLLMGILDKRWAQVQDSWGILCQILVRYIDDIRIYMFPIKEGWSWTQDGW